MKRGTPGHIKTKRLAQSLGVPLYRAVGILECLWHLTAAQAKAGDIGRLTDEEIAGEIGWEGDPGQLVASLVRARWLDADETFRIIVHDWKDHAEDSIHMALARAVRCFADGSRPSMARLTNKEKSELEPRWRAHKKRSPCACRAHTVRPAVAVAKPSQATALAVAVPEPLPEPEPNVPTAPAALVPTSPSWSSEACDDWREGTGGVPAGGRIGKALKPLIARIAKERDVGPGEAWRLLRPWWQRFCGGDKSRFGPQFFAQNPRAAVGLTDAKTADRGLAAMLEALEGG